MSIDLASKLREGTKQSHTMSENTAFMKCFLKGIVEQEPFRKLIANLYFLYCAIEEELERHHDHPAVAPIYFRELNRKANLEQDLAFYYGYRWQDQIVASKEGRAYVDRIHEVAKTEPALLIAHAYVRYMGDLSGGQSLKKIIRSAMSLPEDQGTRFYEFDDLKSVEAIRAFKGKYRDALNSLPIDDTLAQKIVDEANNAFQLNRNVFHELEDDVKAAIGDHVFDLITRQDKPGSTERSPGNTAVELIAAE
ncbi:heme oxygenase (biliverdin-producing) [Aetokthonos hydrillicola Thurmond2011]|jgi:heme oxygenase|uniref:heme oxygenase (biliverdin-producing) n=1 Tax=Aetokthonos hydrillicola Thurmond2011 TaxID=2712845 RepID=A0AAP5IEB0_9CYAN|nr:heme oxygenase (biliverdin-producing) [Aetokthonos hydrillicola]MBO3459894.1 heme oxygenase (biliverdin-producing) [Aetokthonos hydrillicola CCALA 1050]MBW4584011.1 heme oxygenase (biliverdin-producing) [Aetokthonos hydrillicola CCALA 1050]MDR9898794.1 heme oxygenase (biliverdin-producing) [Aetokthonos hydrillicola Thurmond2011]